MTNKLTPFLLLLGITLILWCTSLALSSHLAQGLRQAEHQQAAPQEVAQLDPATAERVQLMQAEVTADPENIDKRMEAAEFYIREGQASKNVDLVMSAINEFNEVLKRDPKQTQALLRLAAISFETGLFDRAKEYYERFLKLSPEDYRAKNDYGLTLLRLGTPEAAAEVFSEIIKTNESFFPSYLALALTRRTQGQISESRILAKQAAERAPDDASRQVVNEFIKGLEESATAPESTALVSPASAIQTFFETHPITGPKLKRIQWPDLNTARVELSNFPVEQMPPQARERFTTRIQQELAVSPTELNVLIVDADSGEILLSVKVPAKS